VEVAYGACGVASIFLDLNECTFAARDNLNKTCWQPII
jgi:hypothetical protein